MNRTSLARQKVRVPLRCSHFLLLHAYRITFAKEPASVCCCLPLSIGYEHFAAAALSMLPFRGLQKVGWLFRRCDSRLTVLLSFVASLATHCVYTHGLLLVHQFAICAQYKIKAYPDWRLHRTRIWYEILHRQLHRRSIRYAL